MASQAPIAIFCYRRPDHLRRTLQSLMQCEGFDSSPVFVFGDGPRNASEQESVEATREVARELLGERAEYHFSDINRGLSTSVIAGIDATLQRFERVIVIEDDLSLAPIFLRFMNEALERYVDFESVFQVSGYAFEFEEIGDRSMAIFLPFTTSWGWATWRRAWRSFDATALGWEQLSVSAELRTRFNLDGAYDYSTMLERQMSGQRDSWAIRWYWSVFKEDGLVLFPPTSLVRNTGFDGSGTHGRGLFSRFGQPTVSLPAMYPYFPEKPVLVPEVLAKAVAALRWQNGGWKARCIDIVRRLSGR